MRWAAVLALAAATRVEVVDQVYRIPASDWRWLEISLPRVPVLVGCEYQVLSSKAAVRIALLTSEDRERLREQRPHGVMAATAGGHRGRLREVVRAAGEYAIVVDNRENREPLRVRLRVFLDFSASREPYVRYLAPRRRLAVILISFAVFFGIVFYSGRKLWRATRR